MGDGPETVTLDLFGTLIDFSIERDEPPLVERLLGEADEEAAAEPVLATWVRESLAERAKTPFRSVRASLIRGAERTAHVHGLSIDPDGWALALEELWAERPLRPDALEAVDRLEARGIAWAIVTNLDAHVLHSVLASTRLAEREPVAVCSEHARAYKPHPRPFRMALERIGIVPGAAVHVGDSPGEDRAGAHAAGMRCLLVDPTSDEPLLSALSSIPSLAADLPP